MATISFTHNSRSYEAWTPEDALASGVPQSVVDQALSDTDWKALRRLRDAKLSGCDWTQTVDAPLTTAQKQSWATYRQALRDLPQNTVDPAAPVWPVKPV